VNKRDQFAGGLAQLQLGMTQDAPPVAVSRVGRCELPLQVHRPQRNRRIRVHRFHADKTAPLHGAPSTSRKIKGRANITGAPFET
jgi:hypothetical protein